MEPARSNFIYYVDRGRKMHQLAYYEAGKRRLKNFGVKSEAETVAWQILVVS
jgi:hypothetical protein